MGFRVADFSFEAERLHLEQGGGRSVAIEVLPNLGANLASFEVDGRQMLHFSREELERDGYMTGCFHMFPVPCRLAGCRYEFAGRQVRQRKYAEDVFLHGLVRDEAFLLARAGDDALACSLEVEDGHPVFEGYPFPHLLALNFRVLGRGLELGVGFENRGESDAPFAYGVHPFWRLHGARESIFVQVPFGKELELDADSIPTGRVLDVAETGNDLRSPRPLSEVVIDNVFWRGGGPAGERREPQGAIEEPARAEISRDADAGPSTAREGARPGPAPASGRAFIEFREIGLRLLFESSANMAHMIGYSPPDKPYVCLENLTAAPNAPNIYRGGGPEDPSGLLVVPPGGTVEAWVRYTVEEI